MRENLWQNPTYKKALKNAFKKGIISHTLVEKWTIKCQRFAIRPLEVMVLHQVEL